MSFKEALKDDIENVFFNNDEFAELCVIDGREIRVIIDDDALKVKSNYKFEQYKYDGVYLDQIVVFSKVGDFEESPVYGQRMKVNGKIYYVTDCVENAGLFEITLGANES